MLLIQSIALTSNVRSCILSSVLNLSPDNLSIFPMTETYENLIVKIKVCLFFNHKIYVFSKMFDLFSILLICNYNNCFSKVLIAYCLKERKIFASSWNSWHTIKELEYDLMLIKCASLSLQNFAISYHIFLITKSEVINKILKSKCIFKKTKFINFSCVFGKL